MFNPTNEAFAMNQCNEPGCRGELYDPYEYAIHSSYHEYHQKIKEEGKKELELLERRFNVKIPCPLADHLEGCYYFPQLPSRLMCKWSDCRREFLSSEKFYEHVSDHARSHQLVDKCHWDNCFKSMKKITFQLLKEHLRVHTLQKLYACPYCGNFFSTKIKFDDHFLRHMPLPEFLERKDMNKVTKTTHSELKYDIEEYNVNNNKVKIFRCIENNCGKAFLTSSLIREHTQMHSNKNRCDECSYVAKSSSRLRSHKLYRHQTEKNFECEFCREKGYEKRFKQPGDLRAHLLTHQIVEPLKCDQCGKETKNEIGFNTHAKLHDKNHDYCCHLCPDKVFRRGNNLSRHLRDKHKLKLPDGQSRFRYRLIDEGVYLLDTGN